MDRKDLYLMVDKLADSLKAEQLGDLTQILDLIYRGCTPVQLEAVAALSEKKLLNRLPPPQYLCR